MFRSKPRDPAGRLRTAVEAMPLESRRAMLRGMSTNTIIAGAYTDPRIGGVCPMLAAHRNGGRTTLASFARSWDRFTGATRARRASGSELGRLRTYLESSLLRDEQDGKSVAELAAEMRERIAANEPATQAPVTGSTAARPGDPDRTGELGDEPGWGWLVPVRHWDGYVESIAAAREQLHEQRAAELTERAPAS